MSICQLVGKMHAYAAVVLECTGVPVEEHGVVDSRSSSELKCGREVLVPARLRPFVSLAADTSPDVRSNQS